MQGEGLLHTHEDLSSIPRTHVKTPDPAVSIHHSSIGEVGAGGSLEFISRQPSQMSKL